jgi:prolyl oligopeptidase
MFKSPLHITLTIFIILISLCFIQCGPETPTTKLMEFKKIEITYPFSQRDTTVSENYFGTTVKDPYRWLEDDQSEATKDWVRKQNIVTNGYLSQIPFRDKILNRLSAIWNFEKFSTPFQRANRYYYFKNDGLQNQSVLYMQENFNSLPLMILDPNRFSKDGTASLQEFSFSKDGRYLAYAVSEGGSDWRTIKVKDLLTSELLRDEVKFAKFTAIQWLGNGFFYSRYPEPKPGDERKAANKNSTIFFHTLGDSQEKDQLIHEDPDHPDYYFHAGTTEDEQFVYLVSSQSTSGNTLAIKNVSKGENTFRQIVTSFENDFSMIDNIGDDVFLLTNHQAPNGRLVRINDQHLSEKDWTNFIPEDSADVLSMVTFCGDKIICNYLHNASSALRVFDRNGHLIKELVLPEIGTVGAVEGRKSDTLAFFSFQSFLRPNTIYVLDINTLSFQVFKSPKIDFNADAFITEQVWYPSKDGTPIPMFISRKKNIAYDGSNPTLLYGYGGFNISLTPSFSASKAVLLESNGIFAVANIRGGGEFGEKWHKGGMVLQKQNAFDDFIAAAEFLMEKKYTAPDRLAIEGGSNGGLLVGACMTQRPDLFGVCFPRVGVLDMLRYHKFTIGYAWAVDYGRSDANETEFKYLYRYSPLHNIKKCAYPSTMITTADHDDRVVPAHSFKFAATLQEHQQGDHPTIIRIDTSAGHGAGKPTNKLLEEAADMLGFMLYQMKVNY